MKKGYKKSHPSQNKEWYLQLSLSKEDTISQLFLLISFLFLGVTLIALNRDFGDPLSWRAILFVTSFLGLVGAYYLKVIYTLAFSLIGFLSWWGAQASEWISGKGIKPLALYVGLFFLALLLYSLGHLHEKQEKFKRFALVYMILGIIVVTGALFFFSTRSGIGTLGEMTNGSSFFGSWQLTLSLLVLLVSLVGTTIYANIQKLLSPLELVTVFVLAGLFGITVLLPEQTMFATGQDYGYWNYAFSGAGTFWALIYNLAIFFELLGLIFSGYARRETWLINMGALFLFLLILVKYFDWFFTFLDKSVFFIGAGLLLFVVGWFMERGRRNMITKIKVQIEQIAQ